MSSMKIRHTNEVATFKKFCLDVGHHRLGEQRLGHGRGHAPGLHVPAIRRQGQAAQHRSGSSGESQVQIQAITLKQCTLFSPKHLN